MRAAAGGFMETLTRRLEDEMEARWLTSSLAEWMETHHKEAAEMLGHKKVDWEHVAMLFAAQGLEDAWNQTPSAATAQETWKRVEERRRAGIKQRRAES